MASGLPRRGWSGGDMRSWRKRLSLAGAIVSAGLLTCGIAVAVEPPGDTINACAGNNGQLRVIATGENCRRNESALDWNRTGPEAPSAPSDTTAFVHVPGGGS